MILENCIVRFSDTPTVRGRDLVGRPAADPGDAEQVPHPPVQPESPRVHRTWQVVSRRGGEVEAHLTKEDDSICSIEMFL